MKNTKLGRPRLGDRCRKVFTASIDAQSYKYFSETLRSLSPSRRRPGVLVDEMVQFCQRNNFIPNP